MNRKMSWLPWGTIEHTKGHGCFRPGSRALPRLFASALVLAATSITASAAPPQQVTEFGKNPGNLKMFRYVPANAPSPTALVVALHGCGQNAVDYGKNAGWIELADRLGFALVLPEQQPVNHLTRCFNFSETADSQRGNSQRDGSQGDGGEAESIAEMVARTRSDITVDARRIFVAGLSAGGGMTAVMLATYPDVFAAGGIIAGVAYKCGTGAAETQKICGVDPSGLGNWQQNPPVTPKTPAQRGQAVTGGNVPHPNGWPRVSIWWGTQDKTVHPDNAVELVKQWTAVHGIDQVPDRQDTVHTYPHAAYTNAAGDVLVETYAITGMGHGQPIDPGTGVDQCGTPASFLLDVNICAGYYLARFWGLDRPQAELTITVPHNGQEVTGTVPVNLRVSSGQAGAGGNFDLKILVDETLHWSGTANVTPTQPWEGGWEWNTSDECNGPHTLHATATDTAGHAVTPAAPVGVRVTGGLPCPAGFTETFSGTGSDPFDTAGWSTVGWEPSVENHTTGHSGSRSDHGYAVSGHSCATGTVTRSLSRRVALPERPQLSYVRKLSLDAMPNVLTKANFQVLINDTVVDEVAVAGGRAKEAAWTEHKLDLSHFANETVNLKFQVSADSNVCMDVTAEAWIDDIAVKQPEGSHW